MAEKELQLMSKSECMNIFQWTAHKAKEKFFSKKIDKESVYMDGPPAAPLGSEITTIAIVLDNEVQEVIRSEGRLTALLLSDPQFVEVDVDAPRPTIGWRYENNKFKPPVQDIKIEDSPEQVSSNEV
jgi:hypothetical protein